MNLNREFLEIISGSFLLAIVSFLFINDLKKRYTISLIDISIWFTGLSFGLAPFIVIIYGGKFPEAKAIDVINSYLGILLFISGLFFVKKYFIKVNIKGVGLISIIKSINKINTKQVFIFYLAFLIVKLIIAIDYGILVSGTETIERISSLPYLLFVSKDMLDLISWGCLFWSIVKILFDKKLSLLPASIIIIETLLLFLSGRRQILFLFFLFLYIYILLGYRVSLRMLFTGIIILIMFVYTIMPAFFSFREIFLQTNTRGDIFDNINLSFHYLSQSNIDDYGHKENVSSRVYINRWNIEILTKTSFGENLNGKALFLAALRAIPNPLLQNKSLLIDPEMLINYSFGLLLTDSPSNWPAYGIADFGLPGTFLYGLIFGLFLYLFQNFALNKLNRMPFLSFIILGAVTFLAFSVEASPTVLFTTFRDLILLYLLFSFSQLFIRRNSKRRLVPLSQ